jgi:hypothetical protein
MERSITTLFLFTLLFGACAPVTRATEVVAAAPANPNIILATTTSTQDVIGEFGVERFGQPLFSPDAEKTDADLGL